MKEKVENKEKTLIIAPNWIGDFVMMSSLIELLRKENPTEVIDIVCQPYLVGIAKFMPVDTIHSFQFSPKELPLLKMWQFAKKIKASGYTSCFILPDALKYAIIPFLAGIERRLGWNTEHRKFLLTTSKNLPFKEYRNLIFKKKQVANLQGNHKFIEKYQLLATFLGGIDEKDALSSLPKLHLPNTPEHISKLFQTTKPALAICPGSAEKPSKKWSYFKELVLALEDKYEIFILGGKTELVEQGEFDSIIKNPTTHNLIDRIALSDVPFILKKCDLVITNDTGLMHIACGVNHPKVIAIFGSSNSSWTPPLSPLATSIYTDIYCRPCMQKKCPLGHHLCMRDISVGAILEKIDKLSQ